MELLQEAAHILGRIKDKRPLVHQITNFVTANDCANVTLAIGASPVMTIDPGEVAEMVSYAGALVLNIGTLTPRTVEAMVIAGRRAAELGIPIILDPVGAGATRHRTEAAQRLMVELPLTVVRGNLSEIKVLAGSSEGIKGVDSTAAAAGAAEVAQTLSARLDAVIAVTGPVDIIAHQNELCHIHNGHPLLASVTGTGCMSTALVGCCAAVGRPFAAAVCGIAVMGIAGEVAHRLLRADVGEGLGSYRVRLIDAISAMNAERMTECGQFA